MLSKLHLHSTIIFIQNVTFIFTNGSNALPVAYEPGAVQKGWNFEKNTEYTFQVSTMASFLRIYTFPGKSRCA